MAGSYTKKNLTEVEDSAPGFGMGDIQQARFAKDDLETQDTGVSYHVLMPDRRQPFGHRHEAAEEVYVVLTGSGRLKLDDEIIAVETMDAIRIAPGVTRQLEAGPEGIEMLAFGPRHDGDGELIEDWWTD